MRRTSAPRTSGQPRAPQKGWSPWGRRSVVVAVLAVLAMLASGCGTRADRAAYLRSRQVVVEPGASGAATSSAAGTTTPGASVTTTATGGTSEPGATTGPSAGAGGTATAGAGTTDAPAGTGDPAAADVVPDGVSDAEVGSVVKIGLHLPETGAAPLPTEWRDALDVVEQWLNDEHPAPGGRRYQLIVEDDGYDPATGLAACRKLADDDVLAVIGHSQPAVEDACADLFGRAGIPYLMRGAQQSLLDDRPLAWFGTISDDLQGGLLADYAIHQLGGAGRKAAVLYENDQLASRDSFVSHFQAGGGQVVAVEVTQPRQADFTATIEKLQQAGAELVFLSQPPVDAIKVAVQAQGQGYHPTFLGAATYWNYNLVLESAGAAMDGAVSFSPWPSVDSAAAAEYRDVFARYRPGATASDVGLVIWGWANVIRAVVEKAGDHLSRASVVRALHDIRIPSSTWNPLTYTAGQHAGSTTVTVFRADGQAKRWRQISDYQATF